MTTPSRDDGAKRSDQLIEHRVGTLLRGGVLLAAGFTALGGIALLLEHGGSTSNYRLFQGEPAGLRTLGGIVSGVLRLDSRSVVQFGLILLIATPVARVLLSLVAFTVQRDRLYSVITAVVLVLLLFSFVLGGRL